MQENKTLRSTCTAVLLCGGKSRRMGFDKAFLQWQGDLLLARQMERLQSLFSKVLLVCERRDKFSEHALQDSACVAEDHYPDTGPLGAVCTALEESEPPFVFVMACDMPHFDAGLLLELWQSAQTADLALCTHEGHEEPLFAFYHRRCLPVFQKQLQAGDYRLRAGFSALRVARLAVDTQRAAYAFANLNTKEELEALSQEENTAMPSLPNLSLVGAFGRNDGKTTLACALIAELAQTAPVVGVKLLCVEEEGESCKRGQGGCGLCGGLKGAYDWRCETEEDSGKDTALMKKAGAVNAYLLRSRKETLKEAFLAFLREEVPKNSLVVCESNRLRLVLKPAVFLFAAESFPPKEPVKPGAWELHALADRVVLRGEKAPKLAVQKNPNGTFGVSLAP